MKITSSSLCKTRPRSFTGTEVADLFQTQISWDVRDTKTNVRNQNIDDRAPQIDVTFQISSYSISLPSDLM